MSKYEVGFPVSPPVQAFIDAAKIIASRDTGGGRLALPSWVAVGYGLRVILGDGEGVTPIGASMEKVAKDFSAEDVKAINEVAAELGIAVQEPPMVEGKQPAGSRLSVWVRAVLIPLVNKLIDKIKELLNPTPEPAPTE